MCSLDNLDFGSANRKKGMIKFIWLQKKGSCNCGNDTKSKGHYVWVSLEKFKTKDYSVSHSRKLHLPYLIWFTFSINFFPITHFFFQSELTTYILTRLELGSTYLCGYRQLLIIKREKEREEIERKTSWHCWWVGPFIILEVSLFVTAKIPSFTFRGTR